MSETKKSLELALQNRKRKAPEPDPLLAFAQVATYSMPKQKLRFAELFAGIGIGRLALESLGLKSVFSSEIDKTARKIYEENFKESPSDDITKIDLSKIPAFDILVAGFPSQSFSIGKKKEKGLDTPSGKLFFEIIRVLKGKKPGMFLIENVPSIKKISQGKDYKTIMAALEEAGYATQTAILNSCNFGTPQHRVRWYCVGIRKDLDPEKGDFFKSNFKFPKGTSSPNGVLLDIVESTIVPREEFELTPSSLSKIIPNHITETKELIEKRRLTLKELTDEKNYKKVLDVMDKTVKNPGSFFPKGKLKEKGLETRWNGTGGISTKINYSGSTAINGRYGDYTALSLSNYVPTLTEKRRHLNIVELGRTITIREMARLQNIPDSFTFPENLATSKMKKCKSCIGQSFTYSVIETIANEMVKFLNSIKKDQTSSLLKSRLESSRTTSLSKHSETGQEEINQDQRSHKQADHVEKFVNIATTIDTLDYLSEHARKIKRFRTLSYGLDRETNTKLKLEELMKTRTAKGTSAKMFSFNYPEFQDGPSAFLPTLPKNGIRNLLVDNQNLMLKLVPKDPMDMSDISDNNSSEIETKEKREPKKVEIIKIIDNFKPVVHKFDQIKKLAQEAEEITRTMASELSAKPGDFLEDEVMEEGRVLGA